MPQPAKDAIRECVDRFVEDVSALVQQAALEAVQDALGQVTVAVPTARRQPRKKVAPSRRRTARARTAKPRAGKRIRRSGADLEAIAKSVVAEVKREPGRRLGEIAAALGEEAKTIRRPVTALMEDGSLRSEGERGGTRYFPGGSRKRSSGRKKKVVRKKARRKTARKRKAAK